MGFLQTLIHDITGHGGQSQQQTHDMGPQHPALQQFQPMQVQQKQSPAGGSYSGPPAGTVPYVHPSQTPEFAKGETEYVQPWQLPQLQGRMQQPQLHGINMGHNPNLGISMPSLQGRQNPGFVPLQNSGFGPGGNPQIGAFQDQPGQLNAPNYGPQQGNYFYDN